MSSEPPRLTLAHIEAAASAGRLGTLCERLVEEQAWETLDLLLHHASTEILPVDALEAAAQAIHRSLARLPEPRFARAQALRERDRARAETARTILRRIRHWPATAPERALLGLAGELLLAAGVHRDAGELFERLGLDERAAEAWAIVGEIDRLEACHARLDERRGAEQRGRALRLQVERLCLSGARAQALDLMAALPQGTLERAGLAELQAELSRRVLRGHTLRLRRRDQARAHVVTGLPAMLGRDASCELPLRDPGVSRRHAVLTGPERVHLADLGSRGGTWLGGARLAGPQSASGAGPPVSIDTPARFVLGERCELESTPIGPAQLRLRATGGIDRGLTALVGAGALPLDGLFPELGPGVAISFDGERARLLCDATHTLRVDGSPAAAACELLSGDRLELGGPGGRVLLIVSGTEPGGD